MAQSYSFCNNTNSNSDEDCGNLIMMTLKESFFLIDNDGNDDDDNDDDDNDDDNDDDDGDDNVFDQESPLPPLSVRLLQFHPSLQDQGTITIVVSHLHHQN